MYTVEPPRATISCKQSSLVRIPCEQPRLVSDHTHFGLTVLEFSSVVYLLVRDLLSHAQVWRSVADKIIPMVKTC